MKIQFNLGKSKLNFSAHSEENGNLIEFSAQSAEKANLIEISVQSVEKPNSLEFSAQSEGIVVIVYRQLREKIESTHSTYPTYLYVPSCRI